MCTEWLRGMVGRMPEEWAREPEAQADGGRGYVNALQSRRRALRDELTASLSEAGADVLLCPALGGGGAAARNLTCRPFTTWVNVVGFPAGVVPVTQVRSDEVVFQVDRRGGLVPDEAATGLPVCVQLVGRMWDDERVLRAMRVVERAFPPVFPPSRLSGPPSLAEPPQLPASHSRL